VNSCQYVMYLSVTFYILSFHKNVVCVCFECMQLDKIYVA
jgi:hypothetical protein